ncbi:hypothetical protein JYU12_02990 [bacterium AH-315-K03]|nr:hypothetical protein [bacterium AH-315-K03]
MNHTKNKLQETIEYNYQFEFKGETQTGITQEQLATGLSRLFKCPVKDLEALTKGNAHFLRDNLNEFTAKSYQQYFKNMGAIGFVTQQTATTNTTTKPLKAHCPKCLSENIHTEQCLDCGLYFSKYKPTRNEPQKEEEEEEETQNETAPNINTKKAVRWLSIAAILLTIAITSDDMLQNLQFLSFAGIDIGYLPFYIAHIALIRGCMFYATNKGYRSSLGLLGFLSLLGLSILLLLPDRNKGQTKADKKSILTALSCIVVSLLWLNGFNSRSTTLDSLNTLFMQLPENRNEYPSQQTDSNSTLYETEYQELTESLHSTIDALNTIDFRPDEITTLANTAMHALAQYEIWINYQRYLHISQNAELPSAINKEALKKRRTKTLVILKPFMHHNAHPRLRQAYNNWFHGMMPDDSQASGFWRQVNQHLYAVFDALRMQRFQQYALSNENKDPDLSQIKLPAFKQLKQTTTKNTLTLQAPAGPLANTPLTLVVYQQPYKKRFNKTGYLLTFEQISPGFPNKYLSGYLNVFQQYPLLETQR